MNLSHQPWIPVRGGGEHRDMSLAETLANAHHLADLAAPTGPEYTTLLRLLTVIAARITGLDAFGPDEYDQWDAARNRVLAEGHLDANAVEEYFADRASRFDLFDMDRPWMQDPRLRDQCPKSAGINRIVPERAAGNNQVWFNTDLGSPLAASRAARLVLVALGFGPAGLGAVRTVGEHRSNTLTAGPLRGTVSYHPHGQTLFETILWGMPWVPRTGPDEAPWDTDLPDPLAPLDEPVGIATALLGQHRHAVLLEPDTDGSAAVDAYYTWAVPGRDHPQVRDPYLIYRTSDGGQPYPEHADADRALWQRLPELLTPGNSQPTVWTHLPHAHGHEASRVCAAGFDQDRQTRDRDLILTRSPPVGHLYGDAERVTQVRDAAQRSGRALGKVLTAAWRTSTGSPDGVGPWARPATGRYWPRAEQRVWELLQDGAHPGNTFIRLCIEEFERATESYAHRPRVSQALAQHERGLYAGWVVEQS